MLSSKFLENVKNRTLAKRKGNNRQRWEIESKKEITAIRSNVAALKINVSLKLITVWLRILPSR